MKRGRWEVVRTDAGIHVRFRSSNGRIIVWSETYRRRAAAHRAIELVTGWAVLRSKWGAVVKHGDREIPVRYVDER